ncbi:MAG: transporter [Weeksellaceae bacterium]|nr:transporter [Bacteroidota bacterium]MCG2780710.1 transporter [Weeksellaceae bacterium]
MMKKISSAMVLLTFSFLSSQESIETDRPDQTESASLTPKNFIQIESGFLYEKTGDYSEKFSHPNILWKYGINDHFEVRMITELSSEKLGNETFSGMMPLTFGFKAKLTEEKNVLPKISFIGHLTANKLSSKHFETTYIAPSFKFLFQHTLSEKWRMGYNLGADWNGETPDATAVYTLSAAYTVTERLGAFAEVFGFLNKYRKADHSLHGGFTYLISNDLQLDASSGFGISEISPDYFISCGVSYRFSTE